MLIVFFRAVILYILIVISIRLMGKRQIGELQPSELVITLLLSNIATLPIEDMTIPMSMGIVPIFTLVCLDVILSHCSLKFRGLRKLICGSPKIVVSRGIIDQKQLKGLRFSADDLLESLRSMGILSFRCRQRAVEGRSEILLCPFRHCSQVETVLSDRPTLHSSLSTTEG